MSRLRYLLTDYRVVSVIALAGGGAGVYFGGIEGRQLGGWLIAAAAVLLLIWLMVWIVRKIRARRAAARLDAMVREQADLAVAEAKPAARADTELLREKMLEAVGAIKSSRLGAVRGSAALYELPWYVIIGNPAAGKSTAILNSGLQFPFEDNRNNVVRGIGGTRNCDWYFTTEGIVLDTAGRYAVNAEDRSDWLTFLDLLRKNRPRAPINGVIIAASIAELTNGKPEVAIDLAKNLRQRVQELTERLEVFVPIYVVFTKADLISGFSEFFYGADAGERENAWGASLPFDADGRNDALVAFDHHFDILADGLRETALAQLALRRGRDQGPGLLTLPLEFGAIKPALRTFIATLFEDNPYQFRPVFRGFYFTSATQEEGDSIHRASERIARQFHLDQSRAGAPAPASASHTGYFLQNLFRKVIFADKQLVRQYASRRRTRLRYAAFLGSAAALAIALSAWAWAYTGNRQYVRNASADLEKAVQVQKGKFDLRSRIEALIVLQQRLEQLEQYRQSRPFGLGLGLYQGERIERKLRQEYFNGMRQIMLRPTAEKLEGYLQDVVRNRDAIVAGGLATAATPGAPATQTAQAAPQIYREVSPTSADDAYNALKAYLMLADRERAEISHLNAELTRYWRSWLEANRGQMTREEMIRDAERLLSFYVAQADEAEWPEVEAKRVLVDDTRRVLREVLKGRPALERVFADIKTRAATRFPVITVNYLIGEEHNRGAITGNYAISGAFSRAAWEGYVEDAIVEAANTQLSSTDWVLDTATSADLTVAGSPEHIQQQLTTLYKTEYAREWRKFVESVAVAEFADFEAAVAGMNKIGDSDNSPLRKLIEAVNTNTIWDNPKAESAALGAAKKGFIAWIERVIMRRNPTSIPVTIDPQTGQKVPVPPGPIGKEFSGFARMSTSAEDKPSALDAYFEALGKVRSRLNNIKTQGDPGTGAIKFMQDTVAANSESELAAALKLVDEDMLDGVEEPQRQVLRALLLRPLIQTYTALVKPTEAEINRVWTEQVYRPFESGIGQRYPFASNASVEAIQADIEQVFGPNGNIARFSKETLGGLVTRRGDVLQPTLWAGIGIAFSPEFISSYPRWVAPLGQSGGGGGGGGAQRVFRIQPQPVSGLNEYTIDIDGQVLRYRNTPPQWQTFNWPGSGPRRSCCRDPQRARRTGVGARVRGGSAAHHRRESFPTDLACRSVRGHRGIGSRQHPGAEQ
jgi:type VI secretion system protein ImpL